MADQHAQPPPPPGLLSELLTDPQYVALRTTIDVDAMLRDSHWDANTMSTLALTSANARSPIAEQQVVVECIKQDQKLIIPAGLAMGATDTAIGQVDKQADLWSFYQRLPSIPFAEMYTLVNARTPAAQIRQRVEALEPIAITQPKTYWDTTGPANVHIAPATVDYVYAYISNALQMNFDVRDWGILNREDMRLPDNAWAQHEIFPMERFYNRLKAFSLRQIAALNFTACAQVPLAAWIRAYSLGAGVLPTPDSRCIKEYKFVVGNAARDHMEAVVQYEMKMERSILALSLNLLSMFGLLHLAEENQFKSYDCDKNKRILTTWINYLGTVTTNNVQNELLCKTELFGRTVAEPFGLGQTYCLARVMARYNALARPLAGHIDVTPPPVQRLMEANSAPDLWAHKAAGQKLNEMYRGVIDVISNGVATVKANPPAFSRLARLYGVNFMAPPSDAMTCANILMPIVNGYNEAVGKYDPWREDFQNVKRDNMTVMWTNLWKSGLWDDGARRLKEFIIGAEQYKEKFDNFRGESCFKENFLITLL